MQKSEQANLAVLVGGYYLKENSCFYKKLTHTKKYK